MKATRRNIWLWTLYDFANSIAFVNVSFYFGLWFVSERGASDAWMSAAVAITTIVMLAVLPILGRASDRVQKRLPFLFGCTVLSAGTLIIIGFVINGVSTLTTGMTVVIFALYALFMLFYLSSFAFYDALLRGIAENTSAEKISAFGMGLGQIGNVAGLLIAFPVASGAIPIPGLEGTAAVFVVAGALFFLCSLPFFLFFKEQPAATRESIGKEMGIRQAIRAFRKLRSYPNVLPYLLTYCLFADALLTLQLFASLYLDVVGGLDATAKNITFLTALLFGVIGSLVSPWIARFLGGTRRAISISIVLWALVLAGIAFAVYPPMFTTFVVLNGFAFGVLFSLSRALFAQIAPHDKQAEMFSLYALFERTASIIGPLLWSGTAVLFSSFGDDKYRFSVLSLSLLVGASYFTFRWVQTENS